MSAQRLREYQHYASWRMSCDIDDGGDYSYDISFPDDDDDGYRQSPVRYSPTRHPGGRQRGHHTSRRQSPSGQINSRPPTRALSPTQNGDLERPYIRGYASTSLHSGGENGSVDLETDSLSGVSGELSFILSVKYNLFLCFRCCY